MKDSYTLTWEEYAELHQDSWPHPDYFSAIFVFVVAVPLIGYGVSLAAFGMPGEGLLSSVFFGAPIFLLAAALLSVTSQSSRAIKRARAEKRADFERWHSTEQRFDFDPEKWTHETKSGRNEIQWSALLTSIETANVFYLLGESGATIVPKRILPPSSLGPLRELAFPLGDAEKSRVPTSSWDLQAAQTSLLWKKKWFLMVFGNVFALVVLGWIVQTFLTTEAKAGVAWGWILATLAVLLTVMAQIWYVPLRYWTTPKRQREPKMVSFSEMGLRLTGSRRDHFAAWKSFRGFQRIGRAVILYITPRSYYLLSKRYFSPELFSSLLRLLPEKLKPVSE